ncbi:MAG: sigma-70 family RNA polymerase sigma factor [Chloroflexi bacterium]|nr:sigma-70 family RNA polymerase sigma factor [Chloroflexota bacterium]
MPSPQQLVAHIADNRGALAAALRRNLGVDDDDVIDDAIQTALCNTWRGVVQRRVTFDSSRMAFQYVLRAASNAVISDLRRQQTRQRAFQHLVAAYRRRDDHDQHDSPQRQHAIEQAVRCGLSSISAPQRDAIIRHYWHGQTCDQIGADLSLSPSAIKGRLHRGRLALLAHFQARHP